MYKLDLATRKAIAQVNTFSPSGRRARQNFVLYGSNAARIRAGMLPMQRYSRHLFQSIPARV